MTVWLCGLEHHHCGHSGRGAHEAFTVSHTSFCVMSSAIKFSPQVKAVFVGGVFMVTKMAASNVTPKPIFIVHVPPTRKRSRFLKRKPRARVLINPMWFYFNKLRLGLALAL